MKLGQYELNNIYNEDCYKAIKKIPDKSVDLIIIDPPYDFMKNHSGEDYTGAGAFGKMGRTYHQELEDNGLINFQMTEEYIRELIRVMKKVNIYIWCNKSQIIDYLNYFKDYNFEIITWHKSNPIPTCSNKYLSDTEYLLFFREKGVKIYGTYETKHKYYITEINKLDKEKFSHPTIKPLNIIQNIIINSSNENDIVLDTFMGSGTTAVACKNTGRNYIGFEINKKYYDIACKRLNNENANGQMKLFTD